MNIVLKNPKTPDYYMVGIWKEDNSYVVKSKQLYCVDVFVQLTNTNVVATFESLQGAKRRCHVWAKIKESRKAVVRVADDNVPSTILPHFAPATESRLTESELLALVIWTRRERYVVFNNVSGMERYFDTGLEYLGYTTDDPDLFDVYDKCGKLRSVKASIRFQSVVKTEDCLKAETVGK